MDEKIAWGDFSNVKSLKLVYPTLEILDWMTASHLQLEKLKIRFDNSTRSIEGLLQEQSSLKVLELFDISSDCSLQNFKPQFALKKLRFNAVFVKGYENILEVSKQTLETMQVDDVESTLFVEMAFAAYPKLSKLQIKAIMLNNVDALMRVPCNLKITNLRFCVHPAQNYIVTTILQNLPNLQHLEVDCITADIVDCAARKLMKLKTLGFTSVPVTNDELCPISLYKVLVASPALTINRGILLEQHSHPYSISEDE